MYQEERYTHEYFMANTTMSVDMGGTKVIIDWTDIHVEFLTNYGSP